MMPIQIRVSIVICHLASKVDLALHGVSPLPNVGSASQHRPELTRPDRARSQGFSLLSAMGTLGHKKIPHAATIPAFAPVALID